MLISRLEPVSSEQRMKDLFVGEFYLGTALNNWQVSAQDLQGQQATIKHFNSIVAENCMKPAAIEPKKGEFHFNAADAFVAFGQTNKMFIIWSYVGMARIFAQVVSYR